MGNFKVFYYSSHYKDLHRLHQVLAIYEGQPSHKMIIHITKIWWFFNNSEQTTYTPRFFSYNIHRHLL